MTIAFIAVLLLALVVIGALILEMRRARSVYESLYQVVLADRDTARAEVLTIRQALFPTLKLPEQPKTQQPPVDPKQAIMGARIPTRLKLKKLQELHNSAQQVVNRTLAAMKEKTA